MASRQSLSQGSCVRPGDREIPTAVHRPPRVIVNADDFGKSAGINRGIIQAHEQGLVTSASLMVWKAAAEAAARLAWEHPRLGVGLHLDFGSWTLREGQWVPVDTVVELGDAAVVRRELQRQLDRFTDLLHRPPTHLDSHQHRHLEEPLRSLACAMAADLQIPLRQVSGPVHYCGLFFGMDEHGRAFPANITPAALVRLLENPPADFTEIACHPAAAIDFVSLYAEQRLQELRTLCDPQVRAAAAQVHLCSFADLPASDLRAPASPSTAFQRGA